MTTMAWRARRCKQDNHEWSAAQVHSARHIQHLCAHCGTPSEPIQRSEYQEWAKKEGFLTHQELAARAHTISFTFLVSSILLGVAAHGSLFFPEFRSITMYITLMHVGCLCYVLSSAAQWEAEVLDRLHKQEVHDW
jgi:hypothetical protein